MPRFVAAAQGGLADDDERQQLHGQIAVLRVLRGNGDGIEIGHGMSFQMGERSLRDQIDC